MKEKIIIFVYLFSSSLYRKDETRLRGINLRADEVPVYYASPEELEAHDARLKDIHEKSEEGCLWFSSDSLEQS